MAPSPFDVQHFIYPLTEDGGYLLDGGLPTPTTFWSSALRGATDEWGLATGYRIIQPHDWVWAYFGGGVRRICGVGVVRSPVGWRDDWQRHTVVIEWNPTLTADLQGRPIFYRDYKQNVQGAAVRANANTLSVLRRWLGRRRSPAGTPPKVSFIDRTVNQRLGQPTFRAEMLRAYRGRCAISGCEEAAVLQAAHIRPVSKSGTHSVSNGILLRADLHNLFDLGLMSVDSTGRVIVSPEIKDRQYRALAGKPIALPDGITKAVMSKGYREHRQASGLKSLHKAP